MKVLVVLSLFFVSLVAGKSQTLKDLIQSKPELSQFYNLLQRDRYLDVIVKYQTATAFVPTNKAMNAYTGKKDNHFLAYHLSNDALTSDKLETEVPTAITGNLPLFVTKKQVKGQFQEEIFINNAKVIHRDLRGQSLELKGEQVLHIIDEVLVPTIPSNTGNARNNPSALEVLSRSPDYNLASITLSTFNQRVNNNKKKDLFDASGHHTFFIPTDDAFHKKISSDKVDRKVIEGHVIPNKVLFTRTAGAQNYETEAFEEFLKVMVAFRNVTIPDGTVDEVQSNTMMGDPDHHEGVVITQIQKGNIPVKNGVIHIIRKPLMIIDHTLMQFLQDEQIGRLYEFYNFLKKYDKDLMTDIMSVKHATIFAPSNEAFRAVDQKRLEALKQDPNKLKQIMRMHITDRQLTAKDVMDPETKEINTRQQGRVLYFNVVGNQYNYTLTVEGGGVNATVVQPDIGATNGIFHIIDRILGIPYRTVYGKLKNDPRLSDTNKLGQQDRFNEKLNSKKQNFTYFVPNNEAWKTVSIYMPSAHKKLFMGEYSQHVRTVLEHHLLTGKALTMEQLADNTKKDGFVVMTRGRVTVTQSFDDSNHSSSIFPNETDATIEYFVEFNGERAKIVRPNVECTNGIIHVIERVLMKRRDLTVNHAPTAAVSSLLMTAITIVIAKFLL